jgi:hypothetical protein
MSAAIVPLYCPRCDEMVAAIRPWRGWRPAWVVYRIVLVGVLALSPIFASDYCVMLPSMMAYLAAGGPLRSFAKTPPCCGRCSLDLDERVRGGTGIRQVAAPQARSAEQ